MKRFVQNQNCKDFAWPTYKDRYDSVLAQNNSGPGHAALAACRRSLRYHLLAQVWLRVVAGVVLSSHRDPLSWQMLVEAPCM